MIKIKSTLCALLCFTSVFAQKNITLEDILLKGTFNPKGVSGFSSMKDGRFYCAQDANENIIRYSFATGSALDTLVRIADLKPMNETKPLTGFNFKWSNDESKLLIETRFKPLYRHSFTAIVYVFDLNTRIIQKISDDALRLADFSPDGNKVAYVKNNNLFYFDLPEKKEIQITHDGKVNSIINGATDWVYEEEFALSKGFYWNESGNKIAYYRFDESEVREFEMTMYGKLYPDQYSFKYPKAGEANSIINIFCYDLNTAQSQKINIGDETDIYIPKISWTKDNRTLCIQRLNRLQNKLELLMANAETGNHQIIYTEENKAYVDVPEVLFLNDKKSFIINSERDGWNHLYLFDITGKPIRQLTKGTWEVDQVYGIDERKRLIYISSSEGGSAERHVYAVSLDGKTRKQITKSKGWNTAKFNSDFTYFLQSQSTINSPLRYTLCDASGKELRVLENNQVLTDRMKEYVMSPAEITSYTNVYGESLNAFIIKPADFNPSKKYPVLMYAYGGPGHQLAVNRWFGANYFWYQMLAQKGYIIVCVDGRGTGFKGEAFKKSTYLQLGKYEIEDQIYVAQQLGRLSYVDASRIGIWGWSFGGYMASLGISKGADVFKTAIAVAPVTNWRYYDNIYTERFMRTPAENGKNYDENSPINHVEKIKGKYLIIHGTADDNVHFQNTVEMIDAMQKKGIMYDSEFYPNKNHSIGGVQTRLHLYERMTRFIIENL